MQIIDDNKENVCSVCGVIIDDGLDHCNNSRNKYRTWSVNIDNVNILTYSYVINKF
jgi:hypothetical protein